MSLSLRIALRYLFSKKSHNAINVISLISVCGIAVATLALVCTLSVFNGFAKLVSDSFSVFDPDLQVLSAKGKVFDPNEESVRELWKIAGIESISQSIQENALARNEDRQSPVLIKGVSPEFLEMIDPEKFIVDGRFILEEGDVQYSISGIMLAGKLGLRSNSIFPIELFSPKRNVKVNLANPATAFSRESVYPVAIFCLNQPKYDEHMMIVSIDLARRLFQYETEVSSLDIKLKDKSDLSSIKNEVSELLGSKYLIKDQFEQQSDTYRMINIEKWVTFLILSFILLIAAFNIVGSLSMLILEKKNDIDILRKLGANDKLILRIFLFQGWLISVLATVVGLVLGLLLCSVQQYYGILKLGQTNGVFIIDAYPVKVVASDILYIFITVSLIAFLVVLYPINTLRKNLVKS